MTLFVEMERTRMVTTTDIQWIFPAFVWGDFTK